MPDTESKAAHTPGDWTVMDDGTTVAVAEFGDAERYIEIVRFDVEDGWHGEDRAEAEANAALIAAAPETKRQRDMLLEQLKRNRRGYENLLEFEWISNPGHRQAIREVIIEIDAAISACEESGQ